MRKVTCASCGRPYDYDSDDFCPKCGSYNPPPDRAGARPAQAPPARVSAASKDRPRPAAQPKTPPVGPRTVSYGGPQGGTPWEEPPARRQRSPLKLLVLVLVSLFLLCIVLPFVLGLMLTLSEAFAGRRPEPGAVARAEPAGGTHALWEPFSIHGTQQVTVEDPWEVDLTYVPLARREGFRCLAVDLWVEGGERRDDLTFFPAELRLEDGTALLAEDDASLARQLKELGLLSSLDYDTLARYLLARQSYLAATQEVIALQRGAERADGSRVIDTEALDVATRIQDRFFKQCRGCANDMGLTVTSRCRLVLPESARPPEENAFERLMREKRERMQRA